MKRRFQRWFNYLTVRYIPGTKKIVDLESKRLSSFITENYSAKQQMIILEEMKLNVIEYRKSEISNKEKQIELNYIELERLKNNLQDLLA